MQPRRHVLVILTVLLFTTLAAGQSRQKPSCAVDLAHCADEGCGKDFDSNLNLLKNIRANDSRAKGAATLKTLSWIKKIDDPENFEKGGSREELSALGEGQKISVVAYLIAAKAELGGESCNCGLHTKEETDNHLVLVAKSTVDKFSLEDAEDPDNVFHEREHESITAEFTPRVRLDHPNFTREVMQPLIDAALENALLVRVTGLLMFDSEHFLVHPLVRTNNWEIHPVLKMEVCTTGTHCSAKNDAGWKSIDEVVAVSE